MQHWVIILLLRHCRRVGVKSVRRQNGDVVGKAGWVAPSLLPAMFIEKVELFLVAEQTAVRVLPPVSQEPPCPPSVADNDAAAVDERRTPCVF